MGNVRLFLQRNVRIAMVCSMAAIATAAAGLIGWMTAPV